MEVGKCGMQSATKTSQICLERKGMGDGRVKSG